MAKPADRLVLVLLLSGCAAGRLTPWEAVRGTADPSTRRQTTTGAVVGFTQVDGTQAWLGVPYAAPPVGPLRWKAPRPVAPWAGEREATRYGERCPQLHGRPNATGLTQVVGSEDCLFLNIYAPPAAPHAPPRPVMVWLHGGGNSVGTGNSYGLARELARLHGVVVVTFNYRLGVLGWLHHPALLSDGDTAEDRSGNYGTLDQLAALRWVHDNIAAFGGDPARVLLFGESAGGFDTFALLASPLARGLFSRAAVQSGLPGGASLSEALHFADDPVEPGLPNSSSELLVTLLVADGQAFDRPGAKKALAALPAEALARFLRSRTPQQLLGHLQGGAFGMYRAPELLRDGTVLPAAPLARALATAAVEVPVLLGTTRDEFKAFMADNPRYVRQLFGASPLDAARYERDAAAVSGAWRALGVDQPVDVFLAHGVTSYAYRFDWDEEPQTPLQNGPQLYGAAHGLEITFVFDDQDELWDPFEAYSADNAAGRKRLAAQMSSYWVQFAKTGDPGRGVDGTLPRWPASDAAHSHLVFDSPAGGGVRVETGAVDFDEVVARYEAAAKDEAPAERCAMLRLLLRSFGGATGTWTPARAAHYGERCGGAPR